MKRLAVMSTLCVLVFAAALQAKDKTNTNPLVGTWNCTAQGGENGNMPFTIYLEQSGQGYTGSVSAPQGDAPISSITFKDNQLKIVINTSEDDYSLTATLANGKLSGEWYRDGQKQGSWHGKK